MIRRAHGRCAGERVRTCASVLASSRRRQPAILVIAGAYYNIRKKGDVGNQRKVCMLTSGIEICVYQYTESAS